MFQAGSVQVRVRRDADEQLVLAHVYARLSNIVSTLTVQIFKDDWTRASTFNFMGNPTFSQSVPYTSTLPSNRGPSPTQDLSYQTPQGASFKPVLMPQQQFGDYQQTDQSNYSLQTGSHSHGPSYQFGQSHGHGHGHSHGMPKQH